MNPFTWILLIIAVPIALAPIGFYILRRHRHRKERRAYDAALQEAAQPRLDWATKIMAAETDEAILSLVKPDVKWDRPIIYPKVVCRAEEKVSAAEYRRDLAMRQKKIRGRFAAAVEFERLSDRMDTYLDIWPHLGGLFESVEVDAMKAKFAEDTALYVAELLESARAGHRQSFIDLVAFTTITTGYSKNSYCYLVEKSFEASADWDDLVVRYYKTPPLDLFRGEYNVQEAGSLRLLAAKALKDESLLLAQVVLAHYDEPGTRRGDRWRQEIGENLMAELGKLVYRLQEERQLTFT